jgi:hypothetical protein
MASSEPKPKYSNAVLYEYAGDLLEASAKPGLKVHFDPPTMRAILRRLRELIEAEWRRKGRVPGRPRSSILAEMVEAQRARGLNETEARRAVAREKKTSVTIVGQAHRRYLKRNPVAVP